MNLLDLARSALLANESDCGETREEARRHWRVRSPGRDAFEVIVHPEATQTEVAELYPGAICDPIPSPPQRYATQEQAAELRELVALVAAAWPDAERAEALAVALADPVDALICWRALVAHLV